MACELLISMSNNSWDRNVSVSEGLDTDAYYTGMDN